MSLRFDRYFMPPLDERRRSERSTRWARVYDDDVRLGTIDCERERPDGLMWWALPASSGILGRRFHRLRAAIAWLRSGEREVSVDGAARQVLDHVVDDGGAPYVRVPLWAVEQLRGAL